MSGALSHQNLVRMDWIHLHKEIGILKHDIWYVGKEVRTDCSITCFPAPDRKRDVQDCALCRMLSTIPVKTSFLRLPKVSGKPKHFPMPPSLCMPREFLTLALIIYGVLAEKVTVDLSKLMLCPELFSYLFRMFFRALQFFTSVLQKSIVSSAKRR